MNPSQTEGRELKNQMSLQSAVPETLCIPLNICSCLMVGLLQISFCTYVFLKTCIFILLQSWGLLLWLSYKENVSKLANHLKMIHVLLINASVPAQDNHFIWLLIGYCVTLLFNVQI